MRGPRSLMVRYSFRSKIRSLSEFCRDWEIEIQRRTENFPLMGPSLYSAPALSLPPVMSLTHLDLQPSGLDEVYLGVFLHLRHHHLPSERTAKFNPNSSSFSPNFSNPTWDACSFIGCAFSHFSSFFPVWPIVGH